MARRPSPTIRRFQLGQELRQLRESAGLTPRAAAAEIEVSTSTLSKIEGGKQSIRPIYVKLLANLYGEDTAGRDRLLDLAEEANQPEWFASLARHVPDWFRLYLGYEAAASGISTYCSELVDGLLQRPEYARSVAAANRPTSLDADLDQSVALRRGRQDRVTDEDPTILRTVMNEAVLHRMVGGPEVMRSQLEHIIEMSARPNVTVQVLPYTAGAHPAMTAPFSLLGFADLPAMDCVYLENGRGALYLEGATDLERYGWMFDQLTALALTPEKSRTLLARVGDDL